MTIVFVQLVDCQIKPGRTSEGQFVLCQGLVNKSVNFRRLRTPQANLGAKFCKSLGAHTPSRKLVFQKNPHYCHGNI